MGIFEIIITTTSLTSIFWLGVFTYYVDKKKDSDKRKIERIFKQKKW